MSVTLSRLNPLRVVSTLLPEQFGEFINGAINRREAAFVAEHSTKINALPPFVKICKDSNMLSSNSQHQLILLREKRQVSPNGQKLMEQEGSEDSEGG